MIFCVEDEANIRELVVYTLETTGFEARGFEEGTSFFEALAEELPELILLDIMLPGEDGMEILKKLKTSGEPKIFRSSWLRQRVQNMTRSWDWMREQMIM